MNEIKTQNQIGIKGAYAYQVIDDATGDVVVDVPEQSNLILDAALDHPGHGWPTPALVLGAGVVTPPTVLDTDMGNQVAMTAASFSIIQAGSYANADYAMTKISTTRDFTELDGHEISEIGIRSGFPTRVLFTRALIKDANGNPTTIQIGAGQTLRITYSLYCKTPRVLGSGVLATPHGDFHWTVGLPRATRNLDNDSFGYLASFIAGSQPHSSRIVSLPTGPNGSISTTVDVPNRKIVYTGTFPAHSVDRVFRSAGIHMPDTTISHNFYIGASAVCFPSLIEGQSYTLPANYNFTISWEVTWGRIE